VLAGACGDNIHPAEPDAAVSEPLCGNGVVELGEQCDDGDAIGDALCDGACHFTCGNGAIDTDLGELCDPGIAAGAGACPATCDDGMACTTDVRSGVDCQAECVTAPITVPADDDGCCPPGATSRDDSDCAPGCGNGVLDAGEQCDTGISGGAGACPTACDDGMACTTDLLRNGGTCQAVCGAQPITMPVDGDGCCPPGATPATDSDCVPGCGDGVVDPGETCDTAIPSGPGRCPAACSDGMACTRDVLVDAGTCTASCVFPPITMPANGDGCCPAGADSTNDSDCPPRCGNGVVETGEQCDDGNMDPNDACNNLCMLNPVGPTAFRLNDLDLRDPHIYIGAIGCTDITDTALGGFSVNGQLQASIQGDDDNDGLFDLSPTMVFRPFTQAPGATTPMQLHMANCTASSNSTCRPSGGMVTVATATNGSGNTACLAPIPGTTTPRMPPYSPGVAPTGAPCFSSNPVTITIDLNGVPIVLTDARIAATYVGNPANQMANGLIRGFLTETRANNTILPSSLPLVGGQPLSVLLPGGDPPGPRRNCAPFSDRDVYNGVRGWWFYFNFPARRVTWSNN
jgi:cysteine-rich repeat protein